MATTTTQFKKNNPYHPYKSHTLVFSDDVAGSKVTVTITVPEHNKVRILGIHYTTDLATGKVVVKYDGTTIYSNTAEGTTGRQVVDADKVIPPYGPHSAEKTVTVELNVTSAGSLNVAYDFI